MIANWATISSISLYFLVGVSFEYARILSEEDEIDIKPLNAVQISLFSFLMLLPQLEIIDGVFQLVSNPDAGTLNGLTTTTGTLSRFGATSLFVTFIVSWYSTRIYAICVQKHIVIKLPDVVPAGVANSFTSLIPVFFVAIVNMLVQGVFLAADIFNPFIYMGGSGCTLMLAVFLFGLAKSEQLRAIGKAEIVPAFFNINEPILFGLPIVYNPNMVIPFIVVPLCTALLTYLEFQIGLIPPLTVSSPWCSPASVPRRTATGRYSKRPRHPHGGVVFMRDATIRARGYSAAASVSTGASAVSSAGASAAFLAASAAAFFSNSAARLAFSAALASRSAAFLAAASSAAFWRSAFLAAARSRAAWAAPPNLSAKR